MRFLHENDQERCTVSTTKNVYITNKYYKYIKILMYIDHISVKSWGKKICF
jgi:hypothetical protein